MTEQERTVTVAIQIENLSKTYRRGFWMTKKQALFDLSLNVQEGEIFGFVGPNGAGKTTTIKILAGLHDASSGDAKIFGIPVHELKSRNHIGFLPERPYFYVHLTPRELLHFYGQLYNLSYETRKARIADVLQRTEMTAFTDVPMKSFSKGMLQRIGLCQCLLHKPKLLILDEPMSGLDPVGRALVRNIILEEHQRGCTIFFSSHVLSDVERICDRVAILVEGTLRSVDSINELISTTHRVEIIAQGENIPSEWDSNVLPSGLHHIVASATERETYIDRLRANNCQILEIRPQKQSLEDILVGEIKGNTIDPKNMGVWT